MVIANTDVIQATIEIFGAVIAIVLAMIFVIITRNEKKSEKCLFSILLVAGLLLILDAGWYIYDGNITGVGWALNWICNFVLFLCNPIMVTLLNMYICNLMKEEGARPGRVLPTIVYITAGLTFCIPVSNIFFHWMYYFSDHNVYYRLDGWYVYTALNGLAMFLCLMLIVVNRKTISVKRKVALYMCFGAQAAGIGLQAFNLGISFSQIGTAIGMVILVTSYLLEWIKHEREEEEVSEEREKIWLIECIFSIMILFVSAAIITCVVSVINVANENSEQNSTALAYMVSETVENALAEPMNVSRTMAQSNIIIDALSAGDISGTELEHDMLDFMNRIQDRYGYSTIFVASDSTKAYYTCNGFSRYMDSAKDSVDAWYDEFLMNDSTYELNIDADKDHDMMLSAFVNIEVRDDDGNFLGVCGVAMSIETLMDMLAKDEEAYYLDIALVNEEGLIQVDTDRDRIENDYYDLTGISQMTSDVSYQRIDSKALLIKEVENYGWYLVIEDNKPDKLSISRIILPSMVIYVIGVIFMFVFSIIFGARERRRSNELHMSKIQSKAAKAESYAKGRFLANMSHEIRTPINAILGMDTMILRESKEKQVKEYAMAINNAGNVLLSLINEVLDFSKIESGKMEILPESYDFSMLILDVMNMISIRAQKKDIEVNLDIDKDLPSGLIGDDIRIRQIVVNLMNNAVKYTEKGSVTLIVKGEQSDDVVKLSICVKDTGIGIKEEDIDKLFEDFVRIEESRNKNIEGTGLGLSIAMQLLELMDSKLEVSSVYGEGSEFSFVIEQKITDHTPIGDIALRLEQKAENFEYTSSFTAPDAKILVVDDNDVNRNVFVNLLKETKLNIDEADCGRKALELIFEKKYDVIFLDHMMPDMNGIDVLHKVKEDNNHPNVSTPIIVLTANALAGVREEYLAAGFDDYLSKPIIPDQLEKMIVSHLPVDKIMAGEMHVVSDSVIAEELPMVEGVDWHYARLHFSDDKALISTLKSFVEAIDSEADKLTIIYDGLIGGEFDEANLELYRIQVHAMKSTATLIGCIPIAGMALSLEVAARNGQEDVIRDLTSHFITQWREYRDKLSFVLEDESPKQNIDDVSLIVSYFNQLSEAADAFDVHGADGVLDKLKQYTYDTEVESIIKKVSVAVNNLDMDEVKVLCEEAIAKIG